MRPREYVIAGAALGALMMLVATGLILLQPGIFSGEEGALGPLLVISLGIGLPVCTALGGVLGWLWVRWFGARG